MIIGILKEPSSETRVSLLAENAEMLIKAGLQVMVESDAGEKAFCYNEAYIKCGALLKSREEVLASCDIVLAIHLPPASDIEKLSGKIIVGVYQPMYNVADMQLVASKNVISFALDMLPRTTRAQAMDVLSSQANVAGYKAVLMAAASFARYFPMFITAAGSIPPAKLMVIGAGVAGLQAVATAKRLGAVVEVFDTRPSVKEEVMSLGAKFIEVEGAADASKAGGYAVEQTDDFLQKQKAKITEHAAKADIIITTAQIPGKKAPLLITEEMINAMRVGSIIVDLAAATGGNTPFTKNNETIVIHGVTIIGNSSLQSTMPYDASKMYGKNVVNFLKLILTKENTLHINWADDLVKGSCITYDSKIIHEKILNL